MRKEEFDSICKTAQSGQRQRVKHVVTHQIGEIIACNTEEAFFEVEVNGERKTWSKDNCNLLH